MILLVGPKGVGKTWVAEILSSTLGVAYVDADLLILELQGAGHQPDPEFGWLIPVERAVCAALTGSESISVEATGAWNSDYQLAQDLEEVGHRVIRVLLKAPEETTIARLIARPPNKVPVSETDARSIYAKSTARAASERWDLEVDLFGEKNPGRIAELLRALI